MVQFFVPDEALDEVQSPEGGAILESEVISGPIIPHVLFVEFVSLETCGQVNHVSGCVIKARSLQEIFQGLHISLFELWQTVDIRDLRIEAHHFYLLDAVDGLFTLV